MTQAGNHNWLLTLDSHKGLLCSTALSKRMNGTRNPSLIVLFCKAVTVTTQVQLHISLTVFFFSGKNKQKGMSVLMPDFSCPLVHLDAFLISVQSSVLQTLESRNSLPKSEIKLYGLVPELTQSIMVCNFLILQKKDTQSGRDINILLNVILLYWKKKKKQSWDLG